MRAIINQPGEIRICVESQGRGKAHRRIQHPQAYTLAVGLSGRLEAGKDQRCQAKYFVAAVYTYPTDREGRSLLAEHPEESEHEDLDDMEVDMLEEKEDGERIPEKEAEREIKAEDIWAKRVEEAQDVAVTNLTFVEPITSRKVSDVLPAIARIYARLREMGLPVYRLHRSGQGADGSTGEALGGGQEHREDHGPRRCFQGEWPGRSGDRGPQEGDQDVAQGRWRTSNLVACGVETCWGTTSPKATTRGRAAGEGDAAVGNDCLCKEEKLEREVSRLEVRPRAGQDHGSGCSDVSYIGRLLGAQLRGRTVLCDYKCNQGARGGDH